VTDPLDNIRRVLDTLGKGLDAAASALTLTDRAAGMVGRGGPRWHLWRALRLRIRAVNAEARRAPAVKVAALRTRAALHIETAARLAGPSARVIAADGATLAALHLGIEPLA